MTEIHPDPLDYPQNSIYVICPEEDKDFWLAVQEEGNPIVSSWMDEKTDKIDIRLYESRVCRITIVSGVIKPERLLEVGVAIAAGREVILCGDAQKLDVAMSEHIKLMTLSEALTHANNYVQEWTAEEKEPFETYASVTYLDDRSRRCHASEAALIAISSSPTTIQHAMRFRYPHSYEIAKAICEHLDDAMVKGFEAGQKSQGVPSQIPDTPEPGDPVVEDDNEQEVPTEVPFEVDGHGQSRLI